MCRPVGRSCGWKYDPHNAAVRIRGVVRPIRTLACKQNDCISSVILMAEANARSYSSISERKYSPPTTPSSNGIRSSPCSWMSSKALVNTMSLVLLQKVASYDKRVGPREHFVAHRQSFLRGHLLSRKPTPQNP